MSTVLAPRTAARRNALAIDVHAVVIKHGPIDPDDVRERLCVASFTRFRAAVNHLLLNGIVERCGGSLRSVADARRSEELAAEAANACQESAS